MEAPLDILQLRDPKGLYKKANAGALTKFTGIDSPYEPPINPELCLNTAELDKYTALKYILAAIGSLHAEATTL
ncbi:adenylyl-sulfate kinase [Paraburkholderia atlantica]|uniref:adenylyl-sulfate kinase n=1 Tax=Paraburkholderia atlantica TaxID=2654982 RepID=UPI003D1C9852